MNRTRPSGGAPASAAGRWAAATVVAVATLYPVALLAVVAAFRGWGERWWLTGVGLYAPRWGFGAPLPILVLALLLGRRARFLWTQGVAAGVLVFPLMGFAWHVPASSPPASQRLRVLSYNTEYGEGEGGYEAIADEVERYAPDVVLLVATSSADSLMSALHRRYTAVYVGGAQFVVASRFPIVEASTAGPLASDRAHTGQFARVVLDTPLTRLVVYAVHPVSPRDSLNRARATLRHGVFFANAWTEADAAEYKNNTSLREAQVEAFATAAARETLPAVIAGDTNLPDLSGILREHLSAFHDGFAEAGWGFGYTFPSDHRLSPWMRIDRILATRALRFVGFQVGTSRSSDHHCVVADVALSGR